MGYHQARVFALLIASALCLFLAAMTAFFGAILWTGCFLGCSPTTTGSRLAGLGMLSVAAASCAAPAVLVAYMWRRPGWNRVAAAVLVIVLGAFLVVLEPR